MKLLGAYETEKLAEVLRTLNRSDELCSGPDGDVLVTAMTVQMNTISSKPKFRIKWNDDEGYVMVVQP